MAHIKQGPGQPLKFKTPQELQEKIDAYFKDCEEKDRPLTVSGLAYALDTSRETLVNYEAKEAYFDTIKKAKQRIQSYAEEHLYRKHQVAGVIFALKNNYNWVDKQEVNLANKDGEPFKINIKE